MNTVCQSCQQPEPNNLHLCDACTRDFKADLQAAPDLMRSMFTTMSKQAILATGGGKAKNDAQPLPLNLNAQKRRHELQTTLINLGLRISHLTDTATPGREAARLAPWIHKHLPLLRKHPEAGHWRDETAQAIRNARHSIDKPAERVSIGKCGYQEAEEEPCPKELLAIRGKAKVVCPECGTEWDVKGRQSGAVEQAMEAVAPPAVIARALSSRGFEIHQRRINKWVENGQLHAADVDGKGRKLYRVSEVYDLIIQWAQRKAKTAC